MSDTPNRSPCGGEYTLLNRLRCWLVGHDRDHKPCSEAGRFEAYICRRCNDFAAWRDVNEGIWFKDFKSAYASIGVRPLYSPNCDNLAAERLR
jgi:hypothetical protein